MLSLSGLTGSHSGHSINASGHKHISYSTGNTPVYLHRLDMNNAPNADKVMTEAASSKKYRGSPTLHFCKLPLCSIRIARLYLKINISMEFVENIVLFVEKNTWSLQYRRIFLQFISFRLFRIFLFQISFMPCTPWFSRQENYSGFLTPQLLSG